MITTVSITYSSYNRLHNLPLLQSSPSLTLATHASVTFSGYNRLHNLLCLETSHKLIEFQTSLSLITSVRNISIIHFSYKRLRNILRLQTSPSLTLVTNFSITYFGYKRLPNSRGCRRKLPSRDGSSHRDRQRIGCGSWGPTCLGDKLRTGRGNRVTSC